MSCACICSAVPGRVGLCISLLSCACLCWALSVFVTVCLSVLGCACICYAVPFFVMLCVSVLGCVCLCYAVSNRVSLCWPFVCLCCLETEYWPWFAFIRALSLLRHPYYPSTFMKYTCIPLQSCWTSTKTPDLHSKSIPQKQSFYYIVSPFSFFAII